MCKTHGTREKCCNLCDQNLKSEQSLVVEALLNRFDALWAAHPELQEEMLQLEKLHPVTGIEILETIEYTPDMFKYWDRRDTGPARGELRETVTALVDRYTVLMGKYAEPLQIGANDSGFFIYRRMKK